MASVPEKLAAAVAALPFVQVPEGWEGGSPLNIPGLAAGLPLDDPWDTVVKASAPGLAGDEVRFAVTADGRTISGGDASGEALEPLVRAIAHHLEAPFWAIAVPDEGDEVDGRRHRRRGARDAGRDRRRGRCQSRRR